MTTPPALTRSDHLRRLTAWVLGPHAVGIDALSEDEMLAILAGDQSEDAEHLEYLEHASISDISAEAPFAAQHWRDLTPTPADERRRDNARRATRQGAA